MLVCHTVEIARLARQAAMIRRGGKLHLSLHLWLPQLEQAREPIQEEQVAERFQSCGKHHQYHQHHQGVTRLAKHAAMIRRGGKTDSFTSVEGVITRTSYYPRTKASK